MVTNCPPLMNHLSFCETLLIAIIDPESPKLPQNIREGWIDISAAYSIGRNFVYSMYIKRRNLLDQLTKASAIQSDQLDEEFFFVNI